MSWRRFAVLVSGLSAEALYRRVSHEGSAPEPLRAADAAGFFASFKGGGT